MRKLILVTLFIVATFSAAHAQTATTTTQNTNDTPNMGRAPKQENGVGRLDLRVVDENGNPVKGVRADLESHRSDGFLCEAWNWTNAQGVAVLPPLHMGNRLMVKLKADGYQTQKVEVNPASLGEPVRVTMVHK